MKHSRLVHLVAAVFVLSLSIGGCRSAPPPAVRNSVDDLIREAQIAAKLASQQADEARAAQQLASELRDGAELRALLNRADEATQKAEQYADKAASLQSQIDDLAASRKIADEVLQAQQAAEEAAAQRAAINRILMSLRKETIHSSIDDVTNRIVQQVEFTGEAGEQQSIKWLDEIVAGSFCDLLVETVATGELPSESDAQEAVKENALNSALNLSGVYDIVAKELIDAYRQLASGKPLDELKDYKEACTSVLTER